MKATGIVRRVDDLGRIVIPREIRRKLNINEDDGMEMYLDEDKLVMVKYEHVIDKTLINNLVFILATEEITFSVEHDSEYIVRIPTKQLVIFRDVSEYSSQIKYTVVTQDNWDNQVETCLYASDNPQDIVNYILSYEEEVAYARN